MSAPLDKDQLRKDFSNDYKQYYQTELFTKEGFIRKKCTQCGKNFWTINSAKELCGDPDHEPYTFIKDKTTEMGYVEFWKKFASFFEKNEHTIIDRYPVVSRWRQDLYFTIASIQDFQRIENGKMSFEYNANPLIVPQMCMRFNDVPNVGVTGRHLSSFMMTGQHAFNYPTEGYWRDRTIKLNFEFLTQVLGVKKKDLTYIEDVWAMGDFSEFGPCLEGFANGSELVNNVFTQYEYANGKINELKGMVVDVGWGFERLLWFYSGADTIYDAVFPKQIQYISKSTGVKFDRYTYKKVAQLSGLINIGDMQDVEKFDEQMMKKADVSKQEYYGIIKPMQMVYAIADHSRSLLFGVTDGALPSNVGGGYNLRIILRRMFDLIDRHDVDLDIIKLMEIHAQELKGLYNELEGGIEPMKGVIDAEKKRYMSTKQVAGKLVDSLLSKHKHIDIDTFKRLYESNGVTPEYIAQSAKQQGIDIQVPENFYSSIIKSDFVEGRKAKKTSVEIDVSGLQKTEKLFYAFASMASAKVLLIENNEVVLDKTPFYAQSGGQEADMGSIDGIEVIDVQSSNGVIVHTLKERPKFKIGESVKCIVDLDRRLRLMAHHSATHLVSASCRKILGNHAWQEGAGKGPNKAHIDIAHYEKLSDEQVLLIERTANDFIFNGIKIKVEEMARGTAESRFGFSIYQGHGVPGNMLRIVEIDDLKGNVIDAEACGGLHLIGRESSIGMIKIINSYRIHDGINRLEFVAGPAALDYARQISKKIENISTILKSDQNKIEQAIKAQAQHIDDLEKNKAVLIAQLSKHISANLLAQDAFNKPILVDYDRLMLRRIATDIVDINTNVTVCLYNNNFEVICIAGKTSQIGADAFIRNHAQQIAEGRKFNGGGSTKIAEGAML